MRTTAALSLALLLAGCGVYSFSGASIPDAIRTIAIPPPESAVATPIPTLPDDLARLLTDRFVRQTRLRLNENADEADAVLEARLADYRNDPTAVSGDDRATRNRVSITVNVVYRQRGEEQPLLERTFSSFADYDPVAEGIEGEGAAARTALRNIADDVFTAATSNW